MRAMHWGIRWMLDTDRPITSYLKLPVAKEIEIGLGVAIWAGLVFMVVHVGGVAAL